MTESVIQTFHEAERHFVLGLQKAAIPSQWRSIMSANFSYGLSVAILGEPPVSKTFWPGLGLIVP